MYTKKIVMKSKNGANTVISLALFILFYTIIGLYTYFILVELLKGNININEPFADVREKAKSFYILSKRYAVSQNLRYIYDSTLMTICRLINLIRSGFSIVFG